MAKTKYMFCSSLQNVPDGRHFYSLDGSPIDQVPTYQYLGIWNDKHLCVVASLGDEAVCDVASLGDEAVCDVASPGDEAVCVVASPGNEAVCVVVSPGVVHVHSHPEEECEEPSDQHRGGPHTTGPVQDELCGRHDRR